MRWRAVLAGMVALALSACAGSGPDVATPTPCESRSEDGAIIVGADMAGAAGAPEPASGYRLGGTPTTTDSYMVVAAHPLASRAGCLILRDGGSAVDAAVAVQAVLGLVEPQSSGLGGGAFMLHHEAATGAVTAYDGREQAPAGATADYLRWIGPTEPTPPLPDARSSGRSIGIPGVVRMLELAHQDHGVLPWQSLFDEGVELAREGFPIGGRMADALAGNADSLARDPQAATLFLNADGSAKALGEHFINPDYAQTLERIAQGGADAFYTGAIAQAIVDNIRMSVGTDGAPLTPGVTTLADMASYQARRREAVCTTYRAYWVCGMPPPSSGSIAVAATLGILENFPMAEHRPTGSDVNGGTPSVDAVHLVSEAERLAYADRDTYIADTDFVPLPGGDWTSMLDKRYLAARAALIDPARSMGRARPGDLGDVALGPDATPDGGTTHFTIVDSAGNVVSMTSSVEASLGSFRLARGIILNNQLTDFSAQPHDADGHPVANRIAPGKRPRSSMAPTLVFHQASDGSRGDFFMGTGSPGGAAIIQYVVKAIVGAVDWNLDAQQAAALVAFGAANQPTTWVGGEHPDVDATDDGANDPLVAGLRARGHTVSVRAQSSGLATIVRQRDDRSGAWRLIGGADPRREGLALGDAIVPAPP